MSKVLLAGVDYTPDCSIAIRVNALSFLARGIGGSHCLIFVIVSSSWFLSQRYKYSCHDLFFILSGRRSLWTSVSWLLKCILLVDQAHDQSQDTMAGKDNILMVVSSFFSQASLATLALPLMCRNESSPLSNVTWWKSRQSVILSLWFTKITRLYICGRTDNYETSQKNRIWNRFRSSHYSQVCAVRNKTDTKQFL